MAYRFPSGPTWNSVGRESFHEGQMRPNLPGVAVALRDMVSMVWPMLP